jgi:hypothetical protein
MSCPYSHEELEYWDGVCNPMGPECYECEDYDCEHNATGYNDWWEVETEREKGWLGGHKERGREWRL